MTTEQPKVVAVMTVPRIGWNDAWGCVQEALAPWAIPVWQHNCVFWAEGLETIISRALDEQADWILTIDYDSLFAAKHLARLMETMLLHPDIDALCPLQARREHHTPLGMVPQDQPMRLGEPAKADAGHFGLTILRVESLLRMPRPWFWGIPNTGGSWDDDRIDSADDPIRQKIREIHELAGQTDGGKIDADTWFWRQWARAGNSAFIDLQCRIGHLEVVCVDFVDVPKDGKVGLRPRMMAPHRWRKMQHADAHMEVLA